MYYYVCVKKDMKAKQIKSLYKGHALTNYSILVEETANGSAGELEFVCFHKWQPWSKFNYVALGQQGVMSELHEE